CPQARDRRWGGHVRGPRSLSRSSGREGAPPSSWLAAPTRLPARRTRGIPPGKGTRRAAHERPPAGAGTARTAAPAGPARPARLAVVQVDGGREMLRGEQAGPRSLGGQNARATRRVAPGLGRGGVAKPGAEVPHVTHEEERRQMVEQVREATEAVDEGIAVRG